MRSRGQLMLWLALLAAFSPVLVDLFRHLVSEPWTRYALVFAPLLAVCVITAEDRPEPSADGYLWLAVGIGAELFSLVGNLARFGRPAFSLGIIGLCRAFGMASIRVAALALWITPIPHLIVVRFSPGLEAALLHGVGSAARALGAELGIEGTHGIAPSGVLELHPSDGGLPLAALLSGLSWYASLRTGAGPWASLRRAVVWGVMALPLQTAAMSLAVGALVADMPRASRFLLDHLWVAAALAGVGWIELRRRAGSAREAPHRRTEPSGVAKGPPARC